MGEWKRVKLGSLIRIKHGYAFPGAGITSDDNGKVLVTPGNFNIGGGFKESGKKFFSGEFPAEYCLSGGDLIVTMTDLSKASDTLGYSAIVPSNSDNQYLHNQRIGLVSIVDEMADRNFIYWLMRTPSYHHEVVAGASGTTVKHTSPSRIYDVEVDLPPLPTQRRIAVVLGALDDKIEVNRKICENLEAQAQALFKAWFVDFEPFGGNRPEGWKMGELGSLIEVCYGKDHKKRPDGNIPVYGSGGYMRSVDIPLYDKESVLIPRKGSLNNILYVNEAFWTVDTMFYSKMRVPCVAKYVHQFLKTKDMEEMNVGSAVPSMTTDILNHMQVLIPDALSLSKFDTVVDALYSSVKQANRESRALAAMRDALLPKLMSGELAVEKVEV